MPPNKETTYIKTVGLTQGKEIPVGKSMLPTSFEPVPGLDLISHSKYLSIGKIVTHNSDNGTYQVEILHEASGRQDTVEAVSPLLSPRGQIGGPLEEETRVLIGHVSADGLPGGRTQPIILGCVPWLTDIAKTVATVQNIPETLVAQNPVYNAPQTSYKMRDVQSNEMIMSSPHGGEIFLSKAVQIKNYMHNELRLKDTDQALVTTSINGFMFTDGVAMSLGPIIRNYADLSFNNVRKKQLRDASEYVYIVPLWDSERRHDNATNEIDMMTDVAKATITVMVRSLPAKKIIEQQVFKGSSPKDIPDLNKKALVQVQTYQKKYPNSITVNGDTSDLAWVPYVEYRIDVDEYAHNQQDLNDINAGMQGSLTRDPQISLVMGNYVWNAKDNDNSPKLYGKILRPQLFKDINDLGGSFQLVECVQSQGVDEVAELGLAFALHLRKNWTGPIDNCFIGLDKQGHLSMSLPASRSTNKLGQGRSMSILAEGNKKEIWGTASPDNNSIDVTAKGGIKLNVGSHNANDPTQANSSININASGAINITAKGSSNGTTQIPAKKETYTGDAYEFVDGNKSIIVTGDLNLDVRGQWTNKYRAAHEEHFQADKSMNVTGDYNITGQKSIQENALTKTETLTNPPISPQSVIKTIAKKTSVTFGNIVEDIKAFGSKKTNTKLGNISNSIIAGNQTSDIQAGAYKVNVTAGMVNIATKAGTLTLKGSSQFITAQLGVFFSGTIASIDTNLVKIGKGAVPTGVITFSSHKDYMTGLPLIPNPKIWST